VVAKALPLRGQVLDIGTGKGRFVVGLARKVSRVTTIDLSAEEQRYARLEAAHAGVAERVEFVVGDAAALPMCSSGPMCFSSIWMAFSLRWGTFKPTPPHANRSARTQRAVCAAVRRQPRRAGVCGNCPPDSCEPASGQKTRAGRQSLRSRCDATRSSSETL